MCVEQVNKQEFSPSSTLMASPIIFQTRVEPTGDCPYRYSSTWVKRQHDKAVQTRCAYPFECQDQVVSDSFSVMSCPGEQQTSGLFFGLKPTKFMGSDGYADFLFAITVCACACVHAHAYARESTHTCTHVHTHTLSPVCMCVCARSHFCTRTGQ